MWVFKGKDISKSKYSVSIINCYDRIALTRFFKEYFSMSPRMAYDLMKTWTRRKSVIQLNISYEEAIILECIAKKYGIELRVEEV